MDRRVFLARVRDRLAGVEVPPLPESFPRTPATGDGVDPDRFLAELAKSWGLGRMVAGDELAEAVAQTIGSEGPARTVIVSDDLGDLAPPVERGVEMAGAQVVRPGSDGLRDAAAGADWGITSAVLGVCSTGSVLLAAGPDAPRSTALLPVGHLVVLPVDRLVPGFEEAIAALPSLAERSSGAVLVTGPSRTTDIEMTMVVGVHGPKLMRVLLVT